MSIPFIVLGDRTDHGGVVVSSSAMTSTHGKGIARVGDKVTCPRRGHGGVTVIVTGDPTMIIDGMPAARHGDKCTCGAMLISSQMVSGTGGNAATQGSRAHARAVKAAGSGLLTSLLANDKAFDLHFLVRDELTQKPLAKVAYKITLEDGTTINGTTDEAGLTEKISSGKQQKATLEVHNDGNDSDSATDAPNRYDACCC
jgi:uncharacterized Zn-binding protein involved in type VI secretion